ncbi:MAG: hypothetical protein U9O83_07350, partial [Campylobacterota bacterium]|nr:hypothetical protein [Campylobacterota bacterium]
MSKIIILILSFLIANADSFNFSELRYSDALDRSIELKGDISFLQNGLTINYKEAKKSIQLLDDKLLYTEDEEEITLDDSKIEKITYQYETEISYISSQSQKFVDNYTAALAHVDLARESN